MRFSRFSAFAPFAFPGERVFFFPRRPRFQIDILLLSLITFFLSGQRSTALISQARIRLNAGKSLPEIIFLCRKYGFKLLRTSDKKGIFSEWVDMIILNLKVL